MFTTRGRFTEIATTGRQASICLPSQCAECEVHTGDAVRFAGQLVNKMLKLWKLWSELLDFNSEMVGNILGVDSEVAAHWRTDSRLYLMRTRNSFAGLLHFKKTINAHGNHGNVQI